MLWQLLQKEKKDIVYLYLYAVLSGLVNLSLPLGIQAIISLLNAGIFASSLYIIAAIVICGVAFYGVLQIFQLEIVERIRQKIYLEGAFRFTQSFTNSNDSQLDNINLPERANRFFDILSMQKNLPKILIDFTSAALQIIFGLLLLTMYHPVFAAIGVSVIAFLVITIWLQHKSTFYNGVSASKKKYATVYWLQKVARSVLMFKHAGNNLYADDNTDAISTEYIISRNKYFKGLKKHYIILTIFKTLVAAAILLVGSWLVWDAKMNIAQLVASEIVIVLTLAAAEKLMFTVDAAYDLLIANYKVQDVLQLPQEKEPTVAYIQPSENTFSLFAEITLPEVSFSLQLNEGEKLCISGLEEVHRRHITKMFLGFDEKEYGKISFNKVLFQDLPLHYIRKIISENILQEVILPGSIYENIALQKTPLPADIVTQVLTITRLNDWIGQQPEGLSAHLDPDVTYIPKNIRRRLVLARTLLQSPKLLLFKVFYNDAEYNEIAADVIDAYPNIAMIVFSEEEVIKNKCNNFIDINNLLDSAH